ncbi:MSCRAMM family protein [Saccharothrix lopnurensis]|uniref:Collagen binding domain-containing protein n=1 Tax=Saccharothrix lopnurensis TaxID=1670621 RepID=A0ABW1PGE5_9PSEU
MLRRLAGAALTAGLAVLAVPVVADAQPVQASRTIGHATAAQGYLGKDPADPDNTDWLGAYDWDGQRVWCVQYSLYAPRSDQKYVDGDVLRSKGGVALSAEVAANISYLLLRYGNTTSNDEAAALAHLLHTWTSYPDPANGVHLRKDVGFVEVAYDERFHYDALAAKFPAAREAVDRFRADAEANRGPWTTGVTAPDEEQFIGTAGTWRVDVHKTGGGQVTGLPVTVELTDATLKDGSTGGRLTTPTDGSPLGVEVVPTGPNPSFTVKLASPAAQPKVRVPEGRDDMQRVVATGGEQELTANASVTAKTPPGTVQVAKTDEETGKPVAGTALKVTAADGKTPAKRQDDTDLTGPEGQPIVLQTGADGLATVPDLRTPQEICVVEVAPAKGYQEYFDPNAPPKACGKVEPGQTLALAMSNKPNKPVVPITIPAGSGELVARASYTSEPRTGALVGFGGVALLGAALVGLLVRRRATARP